MQDSASDGLESQPPERFSISKYLLGKRRSKCPSAEEGQAIAEELSEEAEVGMDPKAKHSEVSLRMHSHQGYLGHLISDVQSWQRSTTPFPDSSSDSSTDPAIPNRWSRPLGWFTTHTTHAFLLLSQNTKGGISRGSQIVLDTTIGPVATIPLLHSRLLL